MTTADVAGTAAGSARSPLRRAVLHYVEMSIVMGLGMAILGPLVRWGFGAADWSAVFAHADARAVIMAAEMAVAMTAWMWWRGQAGPYVVEMAAVMCLPFVALLAPYWAGLISGSALMGLGHALMMLAMAAVVWRHATSTAVRCRRERVR